MAMVALVLNGLGVSLHMPCPEHWLTLRWMGRCARMCVKIAARVSLRRGSCTIHRYPLGARSTRVSRARRVLIGYPWRYQQLRRNVVEEAPTAYGHSPSPLLHFARSLIASWREQPLILSTRRQALAAGPHERDDLRQRSRWQTGVVREVSRGQQ